MAQIKMQYGIGNITPRPIKMDLIKQMQNKQGYTNGTSTGSFTDNQISYDVQASPAGYWEYTVYGKLDISKIKGKTFNVILHCEDSILPQEPSRFYVRLLYSADSNYILPCCPLGGLASGISWMGTNSQGVTAIQIPAGTQDIIMQSVSIFNGVSDNTVDFYVCVLYSPQSSSQTIRPSGKLSIRIEGEQ